MFVALKDRRVEAEWDPYEWVAQNVKTGRLRYPDGSIVAFTQHSRISEWQISGGRFTTGDEYYVADATGKRFESFDELINGMRPQS